MSGNGEANTDMVVRGNGRARSAVVQSVGARGMPWFVLSVTLHGVGAMAISRRPTPVHPPPDVVPLELELTHQPVPPSEPAALEPDAAHDTLDAPPPATPRSHAPARTKRARAASPSASAPGSSDSTPADAAEPTAPGAAREGASAATGIIASPLAAAYSVVSATGQTQADDAAQKLNEAIARGARRNADRPPDPVLHPGPKGGYVYEGLGFDASIDARGNVDMKDRYGTVHIPLVPFRTASGEWRVALFGGGFRLFEWLDRKFGKNDPFQSERRWFLERTRALRERLAGEHAPEPEPPQP